MTWSAPFANTAGNSSPFPALLYRQLGDVNPSIFRTHCGPKVRRILATTHAIVGSFSGSEAVVHAVPVKVQTLESGLVGAEWLAKDPLRRFCVNT